MTKPSLHPLINPDSPHYSPEPEQKDKKTAIEDFEERYTVQQLHSWAMITEDKYKSRLGRKDDIDKELTKMKTYKDYKNMLQDLIDRYPMCKSLSAKRAYELTDTKWRYQ